MQNRRVTQTTAMLREMLRERVLLRRVRHEHAAHETLIAAAQRPADVVAQQIRGHLHIALHQRIITLHRVVARLVGLVL